MIQIIGKRESPNISWTKYLVKGEIKGYVKGVSMVEKYH